MSSKNEQTPKVPAELDPLNETIFREQMYAIYQVCQYPSKEQYAEWAQTYQIQQRRIRKWFDNRRTRDRERRKRKGDDNEDSSEISKRGRVTCGLDYKNHEEESTDDFQDDIEELDNSQFEMAKVSSIRDELKDVKSESPPVMEQSFHLRTVQHVSTPRRDRIIPESQTLFVPAGCSLDYEKWTPAEFLQWTSNFLSSAQAMDIIKSQEISGDTMESFFDDPDFRKETGMPYGPFQTIKKHAATVINRFNGYE